MNKKLHIVSFTVEDEEEGNSEDKGDNGNDDGNDDPGKHDSDEDIDDLDDQEKADTKKDGESGLKTPSLKTGKNLCSGYKTVKSVVCGEDSMLQEHQLRMKMNQNKWAVLEVEEVYQIENMEEAVHLSELGSLNDISDGRINPLHSVTLTKNGCTEFKHRSGIDSREEGYSNRKVLDTEKEESGYSWKTPRGNVLNMSANFLFEGEVSKELQQSKWKEFRRLAKSDSSTLECSLLLKQMELDDSDNEKESEQGDLLAMSQEAVMLEDADEKVRTMDDDLGGKQLKRKNQWGPTQRIDRPRRHVEDGKTVMQRAQELKERRNVGAGSKMEKREANSMGSDQDAEEMESDVQARDLGACGGEGDVQARDLGACGGEGLGAGKPGVEAAGDLLGGVQLKFGSFDAYSFGVELSDLKVLSGRIATL